MSACQFEGTDLQIEILATPINVVQTIGYIAPMYVRFNGKDYHQGIHLLLHLHPQRIFCISTACLLLRPVRVFVLRLHLHACRNHKITGALHIMCSVYLPLGEWHTCTCA